MLAITPRSRAAAFAPAESSGLRRSAIFWFPPAANDSGGLAFAWCKPPAVDP